MTSTLPVPRHDFRIQPRRALRAVRRLIADKEDTTQVFEIMSAMAGRSTPKGYARLLREPGGGPIAMRARELAPLLDDHARLATLPEGSVGRAYLAFITAQGLSAEGLAEESRRGIGEGIEADHPWAWYGRRLRDTHDLWHTLTGYGRDALGEVCLVAFSHAQTRSTGFAVIAAAGANVLSKSLRGHRVRRTVWQAWRDGRRCEWLPGVDYEALLSENLDAARARLRIPRPDLYLAIPEADREAAYEMGATPQAT